MANPPQNSPSLGVTDAPDQRAPHREARNHHPLILKSLNWAQQRPRFLFDPPYDPLGQKEQQKLVSQAGKSSRYPLKSAAGRHPGKPECPPPLGVWGWSVCHSVVSDSLWPPGLSRGFCRQDTVVGWYSLLWGIFPTEGSNLGLLHCRQIIYLLSYQGSPWGRKDQCN